MLSMMFTGKYGIMNFRIKIAYLLHQERRHNVVYRSIGCLLLVSNPSRLKALASVGIGREGVQLRAFSVDILIAPQVFTRVLRLVSTWSHQWGIRPCCYLNDWLVMANSIPCLLEHQ